MPGRTRASVALSSVGFLAGALAALFVSLAAAGCGGSHDRPTATDGSAQSQGSDAGASPDTGAPPTSDGGGAPAADAGGFIDSAVGQIDGGVGDSGFAALPTLTNVVATQRED